MAVVSVAGVPARRFRRSWLRRVRVTPSSVRLGELTTLDLLEHVDAFSISGRDLVELAGLARSDDRLHTTGRCVGVAPVASVRDHGPDPSPAARSAQVLLGLGEHRRERRCVMGPVGHCCSDDHLVSGRRGLRVVALHEPPAVLSNRLSGSVVLA